MEKLLAMDPYARYLLIAYGVTTLVVIGNLVAARRQFRSTQQRLREQLARRPIGTRGGNEAAIGRGS